jgi:hypothetical protein
MCFIPLEYMNAIPKTSDRIRQDAESSARPDDPGDRRADSARASVTRHSATVPVAPPEIATPDLEPINPGLAQKSRFDPHMAVEVLEKLTDMAADRGEHLLGPGEPIVAAAALLLRDVKAWLRQHVTPFDSLPGDAIVDAYTNSSFDDRDSLVAALQGTALELVQVQRLRDYQRTRPSTRPGGNKQGGRSMNDSKSGNGRQEIAAGMSTDGSRSPSDGDVDCAFRCKLREIALSLDDITYYTGQVLAHAMESDSGFFGMARDFTEKCLRDLEASVKQHLGMQEGSSKAVAEGQLVHVAELLARLRQPDLTVRQLKELADAALSLIQSMSAMDR